MKKRTKTFFITLVMLTLTFGLSTAYGQNVENDTSPVLFEQDDNANSIVGTWISDVTITDCQSGNILARVKALNTFNQGGTMMEAGGGNPALRGPGHGTWERTRGNKYKSVFMFFRFNPDGSYAGFQKVQRVHSLDFEGNTITTTATFDVFNANGIRIATACATETAVRLNE